MPEWRAFNYPLIANKKYASIKVSKISPVTLQALLQEDRSIYVLDVRPIDCDRENIFIKNSQICPMVYLSEWYTKIPKDSEIIVTDWTNKKAILAAKFLISKGYNVTGVLKGGIIRWRDEKLPVVYVEKPLQHITQSPCPE